MSRENPLWGAPRVHGELLKLGIKISQATVSKVMVRHPRPPSQTRRTFLANHVGGLASIDLFVVPTATFRLLYVCIVLRHERRKVVHFNVTSHPTAAWLGQQLVAAFPWESAPRYLIRDRDAVCGTIFRDRLEMKLWGERYKPDAAILYLQQRFMDPAYTALMAKFMPTENPNLKYVFPHHHAARKSPGAANPKVAAVAREMKRLGVQAQLIDQVRGKVYTLRK